MVFNRTFFITLCYKLAKMHYEVLGNSQQMLITFVGFLNRNEQFFMGPQHKNNAVSVS